MFDPSNHQATPPTCSSCGQRPAVVQAIVQTPGGHSATALCEPCATALFHQADAAGAFGAGGPHSRRGQAAQGGPRPQPGGAPIPPPSTSSAGT